MKPKFCAICKQKIDALEEKILVEKHSVHKRCFNCAICDASLMAGNCAFDDQIYHYFGPLWFCPAHMMLGSGEKLERLKQKFGAPEVGGSGGPAKQKPAAAGESRKG